MTSSNSSLIENHITRRFNIIKKVGSGAYGHVWKVEQNSTKKILALKKIFDAFQHATDAQRTYRQIEILKQTHHINIIQLHDTLKADNNKDVYLVFQYVQSDLHNVIASDILKDIHIRFIIYQIAKALKYLHSGFVIHRDLKPSNILVDSNCMIKLCDFGLVRSILVKDNNRPVLTEGVATRWYRAPEILLGSKSYSTPADVWSFGCIIYQMLTKRPLFAGNSTIDQLQKICQYTGYPSEEDVKCLGSQSAQLMLKQIKLPHSYYHQQPRKVLKQIPSKLGDLLEKMIVFNPMKRITIEQILSHQCVGAFRKPEEEKSCVRELSTEIDDSQQLTVEEYRKLIYGQASNCVGKGRARSDFVNNIGKSHSVKLLRNVDDNFSGNKLLRTVNCTSNKELTKNSSFKIFKPVKKTVYGQKWLSSSQKNVENKQAQATFQQRQNLLSKVEGKIVLKQTKANKQLLKKASKKQLTVPNFIVSKGSLNQKIENNKSWSSLGHKQNVHNKQDKLVDVSKYCRQFLTEASLKNKQLSNLNRASFIPSRSLFSQQDGQQISKKWSIKKSVSSYKGQFPRMMIKDNKTTQLSRNDMIGCHLVQCEKHYELMLNGDHNQSNQAIDQDFPLPKPRMIQNVGKGATKHLPMRVLGLEKIRGVDPQKVGYTQQQPRSKITVWNQNKLTLVKKQSKTCYLNSQKYLKTCSTNPQTTQLTKSEFQNTSLN